jgi:signal transduction histidine kinase
MIAFTTTIYVVSYLATWAIAELRRRQQDVVSLRNELLARTQELETSNEELLQLSRMRTRFMAMASHDLKNPIAAVESYLQVLLGGFIGEPPERHRDVLLRCSQRLRDLIQLMNDFVDLSLIQTRDLALEFEPTSLTHLMEKSLEDVRPLLTEKETNLRLDIPEDTSDILCSPQRLRKVLINLLTNAIMSTPERGTVILRMMEVDAYVRLEILDTGPGIPPDELPFVFDEFYRVTSLETAPSGLGLAIARRLVEAHGGTISVQSPYAEGQSGTQFAFILPKNPEVPPGHQRTG